MELREYFRFIRRFAYIIVAGIVLGSVVGSLYAMSRPEHYQSVMSLFVRRQTEVANIQYFTYEGYYAQQSAAAYTENALKLISNDEILRRAAKIAGMGQESADIQQIRGAIVSKKDAPQIIKLTVTMPTKDGVTRLTNGVAQALKTRTDELNQAGDNKLSIEPVNSEPIVMQVKQSPLLYGVAGSILGLLGTLVGCALWWYAKPRH
jgi:uncharacterized protein involved in exopolysaccharide biosynthesis